MSYNTEDYQMLKDMIHFMNNENKKNKVESNNSFSTFLAETYMITNPFEDALFIYNVYNNQGTLFSAPCDEKYIADFFDDICDEDIPNLSDIYFNYSISNGTKVEDFISTFISLEQIAASKKANDFIKNNSKKL